MGTVNSVPPVKSLDQLEPGALAIWERDGFAPTTRMAIFQNRQLRLNSDIRRIALGPVTGRLFAATGIFDGGNIGWVEPGGEIHVEGALTGEVAVRQTICLDVSPAEDILLVVGVGSICVRNMHSGQWSRKVFESDPFCAAIVDWLSNRVFARTDVRILVYEIVPTADAGYEIVERNSAVASLNMDGYDLWERSLAFTMAMCPGRTMVLELSWPDRRMAFRETETLHVIRTVDIGDTTHGEWMTVIGENIIMCTDNLRVQSWRIFNAARGPRILYKTVTPEANRHFCKVGTDIILQSPAGIIRDYDAHPVGIDAAQDGDILRRGDDVTVYRLPSGRQRPHPVHSVLVPPTEWMQEFGIGRRHYAMAGVLVLIGRRASTRTRSPELLPPFVLPSLGRLLLHAVLDANWPLTLDRLVLSARF